MCIFTNCHILGRTKENLMIPGALLSADQASKSASDSTPSTKVTCYKNKLKIQRIYK